MSIQHLKKILLPGIIAFGLMLSGCVTTQPAIDPAYSGPRANIRDTALAHSASKVDYFVVLKVGERKIENSWFRSVSANQGRGFNMEPVLLDRDIPAGQEVTLEIIGRTEYAAPILALTNAVYQVKGTVTFMPEENHAYTLKGTLGPDYSGVWVEDMATGTVVGKKVEIHGSGKLGFFQK